MIADRHLGPCRVCGSHIYAGDKIARRRGFGWVHLARCGRRAQRAPLEVHPPAPRTGRVRLVTGRGDR